MLVPRAMTLHGGQGGTSIDSYVSDVVTLPISDVGPEDIRDEFRAEFQRFTVQLRHELAGWTDDMKQSVWKQLQEVSMTGSSPPPTQTKNARPPIPTGQISRMPGEIEPASPTATCHSWARETEPVSPTTPNAKLKKCASKKSICTSEAGSLAGKSDQSGNRRLTTHNVQKATVSPQIKRMPSNLDGSHRKVLGIVNHGAFDVIVAITILLNGVLVGSQTDYMARTTTLTIPVAFKVLDYCFCGWFTVELCLRIYAYRSRFFSQETGVGWNVFDLVIVILQISEIFMTALAMGSGFSFTLLRSLRLVRVLRLARTLRLIGELRTIVSSIASSMKPLLWTGILLFMIVYVLSVYVTQVVLYERVRLRDANEVVPLELERYWGSLIPSMYSLFQSITGGVDWDMVARPLVENIGPEVGVLFTLYIMFTVFAMLNVVTGVFIQNVLQKSTQERDSNKRQHVQELFKQLDMGVENELSREEFEDQLDSKPMQEFFETIDVDISNAQCLFDLLDADDSGAVDADEFMEGCWRIWQPSKGFQMMMIMRELKSIKANLNEDFSGDPGTRSGRLGAISDQLG